MTTLPERLLEIIDMQLRLNLLLPADAPNSRGCNARLRELQDALEAAQALQAAPEGGDTARLDWLEMQVVEVSKNLRHGCTRLFLCGPLEDDGEYEPSHLRACIDAYLAAPSPTAALQAGEV